MTCPRASPLAAEDELGARAALSACARLAASPDLARQWFLDLEHRPERYRLETHEGFRLVSGRFGRAGTRIETRERFYGVRLRLRFELASVSDRHVTLRLLGPVPGVWAAFQLDPLSPGTTALFLRVWADSRVGRWVLRLAPVRGAVQRQIEREVAHIARSIEAGGRADPRAHRDASGRLGGR